jgi:hypothetical protein
LGFFEWYQDSNPKTLETEAREIIREMSGILSQAAAIKMDAGFKAPNKVIATLEAVKRDPSLIMTRTLEPEALGMLAFHYQRDNETAGTYWWDLEQQGYGPVPESDRVRVAASMQFLRCRQKLNEAVRLTKSRNLLRYERARCFFSTTTQ